MTYPSNKTFKFKKDDDVPEWMYEKTHFGVDTIVHTKKSNVIVTINHQLKNGECVFVSDEDGKLHIQNPDCPPLVYKVKDGKY